MSLIWTDAYDDRLLIESWGWQSLVDINLLLMYSRARVSAQLGAAGLTYFGLLASYWSDVLECFAELESSLAKTIPHKL